MTDTGSAEVEIVEGRTYRVTWHRTITGRRTARIDGPLEWTRPGRAVWTEGVDQLVGGSTRDGWHTEALAALDATANPTAWAAP